MNPLSSDILLVRGKGQFNEASVYYRKLEDGGNAGAITLRMEDVQYAGFDCHGDYILLTDGEYIQVKSAASINLGSAAAYYEKAGNTDKAKELYMEYAERSLAAGYFEGVADVFAKAGLAKNEYSIRIAEAALNSGEFDVAGEYFGQTNREKSEWALVVAEHALEKNDYKSAESFYAKTSISATQYFKLIADALLNIINDSSDYYDVKSYMRKAGVESFEINELVAEHAVALAENVEHSANEVLKFYIIAVEAYDQNGDKAKAVHNEPPLSIAYFSENPAMYFISLAGPLFISIF